MPVTEFMNLDVPDVGDEGTAYAARIVEAFQGVDAHNHSEGQGNPIPVEGININADLEANGNSIIELKSTAYEDQTVPLIGAANVRRLYFLNGELCVTDGDGTDVQLTSNGEVNSASVGGISGMGGTDAAVSYNSATQVFQFLQNGNTNQAAHLDASTLKLRSTTAGNSVYVTLARHASQTSNFTLTTPQTLPLSTSVLTLSNTGAIGTTRSPTLDNPTISTATITTAVVSTTNTSFLNVTGSAAIPTVTGNVSVAGNVTVGGDVTVGDDLTVTDDVTIGDDLTVNGTINATTVDISGSLTVGGDTNVQDLGVNGYINLVGAFKHTPRTLILGASAFTFDPSEHTESDNPSLNASTFYRWKCSAAFNCTFYAALPLFVGQRLVSATANIHTDSLAGPRFVFIRRVSTSTDAITLVGSASSSATNSVAAMATGTLNHTILSTHDYVIVVNLFSLDSLKSVEIVYDGGP